MLAIRTVNMKQRRKLIDHLLLSVVVQIRPLDVLELDNAGTARHPDAIYHQSAVAL
jgi:hypothetical protein